MSRLPDTAPPSDDVVSDSGGVWFNGVEHRSRKRYSHGTHRTVPPEDTLERIAPLMDRAGITRLADITGLDTIGVPVTLAIRPNSRWLVGATGKGVTKTHADVSGLMEAFECYHAEFVELPVRVASYRSLADAGEAMIPVDQLPLAATHDFDVDAAVSWVQGFDLMQGVAMPVPEDYVHLSRRRCYSRPPEHKIRYFQRTSNGLASGNSLLEAVCAGLYEFIERDAISLASIRGALGGGLPPAFDPTVQGDATVQHLVEMCCAAGAEVRTEELTNDVGVPTYRAALFDSDDDVRGFSGYGAHLDPQVALSRAITEAVQSRTVTIAGSRDDLFADDRRLSRHLAVEQEARSAELRISASLDRAPSSGPTDSFEGDLHVLFDLLHAVGVDSVIAVDLTDPRIGIDVVKVFVPGLEDVNFFEQYRPKARANQLLAQFGAGKMA